MITPIKLIELNNCPKKLILDNNVSGSVQILNLSNFERSMK